MEVDYSKLHGRIIEKFGSQTNFAEALGVDITIVCAKLGNKRGITKKDVFKWSDLLEIPYAEIGVYFFTPKLNKC